MTFIPYYDDIKEALGKPGCAFCRLRDKTTYSYVDALLFELVNDPEAAPGAWRETFSSLRPDP